MRARPHLWWLCVLIPGAPAWSGPTTDEVRNGILTKLYSEDLKSLVKETKKAGSLSIEVTGAPDAYRHAIAEGYILAVGSGLRGKGLWAEVRELHQKHKAHRKKRLFHVTLTGASSHFVQDGPKNLVGVRSKALKSMAIIDIDPPLKFEPWQVFESAQLKKRTLAHFSRLCFDVVVSLKDGSKDPLVLGIQGLAKQDSSGDRKNSLNLEKKQISCRGWTSLLEPPAAFTFIPSNWELPPPPEGFEELMDELEAEKDEKGPK